ncbi:glycosyltransferase [Enterococcus sp. AZ102]|uniref:glycosyltransferase n=1 Tax=Enterococcus sp. AZ102 TaxID=2774865 RepID=UPI003F29398E
MKKILVVTNSLKNGVGISEWIKKYYSKMVDQYPAIKIEILVESGYVDFELNEKITVKQMTNIRKNPVKYLKEWYSVKQHVNDYEYIHFHVDNLVKFLPYKILGKQDNIIIHSHNATNDKVTSNPIKKINHNIGKKIIKNNKYEFFACSNLAAKWLFDDNKYIQINNGIDTELFKYDPEKKMHYREEFKIKNEEIIFGHVGRFTFQKNHNKLIDIFYEIKNMNNNAKLLLVGVGELESEIKSKVESYNLSNSVHFLGYRDDVKDIMNVFDIFIFPSYYEGLPISLVETQTNGLITFYSNQITKEVELTESIFSFDINEESEKISEQILDISQKIKNKNREADYITVKNKGYDEATVLEQLYHYYNS